MTNEGRKHMNSVNWDRVNEELANCDKRAVAGLYGLPNLGSPARSVYYDGVVSPPWEIPEEIVVQVAITGDFIRRDDNPNQPYSSEEVLAEAQTVARAGASAVHIHVRNEMGHGVLEKDRFEAVVRPLRDEFPDLHVDGCLVPFYDGEYDAMVELIEDKLFDGCPINPTAAFEGDTLFAKPPALLLDKTRRLVETNQFAPIGIYTDGDIANADRWLFRSGLLKSGQTWGILPALPGCTPMLNARQMFEGLLRNVAAIKDVDPEAKIMVCSSGRASSYVVTAAALLGLHIRVGMEDTMWRWPHREDLVQSNLQAFEQAKLIAQVTGRTIASPARARELMGVPGAVTPV
ncbi:3-keto-5-aminohexanoate cleavage protein [Mycobacteroides immunogenum]|nr:3-keto-5-aminohexanoate cleavage protein [Mycobacteroides immunogenum]